MNQSKKKLSPKELMEEIAEGKAAEFLEGASQGTRDQVENQMHMVRRIAVIFLGSILFNKALAVREDGGQFHSKMMIEMDKLKEDIQNEIERNMKALENGEMDFIKPLDEK